MTNQQIIDGFQFTIDMFLFDPSKGEVVDKHRLNDENKLTVDACEEAIKILKAKADREEDCISRQAVIGLISRNIEEDDNGNYCIEDAEVLEIEVKELPSVSLKGMSEVIEEIKAEIESYKRDTIPHCIDEDYCINGGLQMALDVLEEYTGGTE